MRADQSTDQYEIAWSIGGDESEETIFGDILDVVSLGAGSGTIAVLDRQSSLITLVGEDGRIESVLGGEGDGPGELRGSVWINTCANEVIAVGNGSRVDRFSATGWRGREWSQSAQGVVWDCERVFVHRTTKYPADGAVGFRQFVVAIERPNGDALVSLVPRDSMPGVWSRRTPFSGSVRPWYLPLTRQPITKGSAWGTLYGPVWRSNAYLISDSGRVLRSWTWEDTGVSRSLNEARETWKAKRASLVERAGGATAEVDYILPAWGSWGEDELPVPRYESAILESADVLWVKLFSGSLAPAWALYPPSYAQPAEEWLILNGSRTADERLVLPEGFSLKVVSDSLLIGVYTDSLGIESLRALVRPDN
jgi:hypothetical protein